MRAALDAVADDSTGSTAVVVSHGGAIALAMPVMCGNLDPHLVVSNLLANTDVVELERDESGWRCLRWAGHDV
jgi:broad specificity phosphatase PhoE